MTKYVVKLTEQEELSLRQLMRNPDADVLLKLLQGESFDAQTAAMECTDPDEKKRLLLLTDAQATARIVSSLTRKLCAYREVIQPTAETGELDIIEDLWKRAEGQAN